MSHTSWVGSVLGTQVTTTRPLGGQAVYVELADGRKLVLKGVPRQQQSTWQPGKPWTELVVTDIISAAGGPVPALAAADVNAGWLLRAYVSGPTVGSLLRQGKLAAVHFMPLIQGLAQLQRILAAEQHALKQYVTVTSREEVLPLARSITPFLTPAAQRAWLSLVSDVITDEAWRLGPTDLLPDNVIIGRAGPQFIDLATIGWDYDERRFVGYTQSADPLAPATCLTDTVYAAYKDAASHQAALRLAVFDHLFWGLALVRLLAMQRRPGSRAARQLQAHWTPDEQSWDRFHALWARPRLDDARLETIRRGWHTR